MSTSGHTNYLCITQVSERLCTRQTFHIKLLRAKVAIWQWVSLITNIILYNSMSALSNSAVTVYHIAWEDGGIFLCFCSQ